MRLHRPRCWRQLGFGWRDWWRNASGAALVVARVLYQWPTECWVQGRVRRACSLTQAEATGPGFSHEVGYASSSPLRATEANTLLDEASQGPACRWHLLLPVVIDCGPTALK